MNPSLSELQAWMKWAITDSRGVAQALEASSPSEPAPRLLESIHEVPPIARISRLNIYAEGYFARLLESLKADFPTVRRVMGEDAFGHFIADYLDEHPSRFTGIGDIGVHLSGFARAHAYGEEVPPLSDLAALEWAVLESFYADDSVRLSPEKLAAIPETAWPDATLTLNPSVRLLRPQWHVHNLWYARQTPEPDSEEVEDTFPPECPNEVCHLLIHRENFAVQVSGVAPSAWEMLSRIQRGQTLGAICADMEAQSSPGSELPLMEWFTGWVMSGVICGVNLAPQPPRG